MASVSGFGIGSLLTPLLALHAVTKTAVAAVSIPHLIGTGIRFWLLRGSLDRDVLWRVGMMSAAERRFTQVVGATILLLGLATLLREAA